MIQGVQNRQYTNYTSYTKKQQKLSHTVNIPDSGKVFPEKSLFHRLMFKKIREENFKGKINRQN